MNERSTWERSPGFSALLWSLVSPRDRPKSPCRFAGKALGAHEEHWGVKGGAHGELTSHLRTRRCRAERRVITRRVKTMITCLYPGSVQSICSVWPGGTSAIRTDDHRSLYVVGGVKERNCLCWCLCFPSETFGGGSCALLRFRFHIIVLT